MLKVHLLTFTRTLKKKGLRTTTDVFYLRKTRKTTAHHIYHNKSLHTLMNFTNSFRCTLPGTSIVDDTKRQLQKYNSQLLLRRILEKTASQNCYYLSVDAALYINKLFKRWLHYKFAFHIIFAGSVILCSLSYSTAMFLTTDWPQPMGEENRNGLKRERGRGLTTNIPTKIKQQSEPLICFWRY